MNDFGLMCICAARYAMGRQTYVTDAIPSYIIKNMDKLDKNDLRVLRRDLRREIERGNYGDPNVDLPHWQHLIDEINKVVEDNGDY